jgi:hypothetical protein
MSTMTANKPKKAAFVIKVEDRNNGKRFPLEITARSVHEAEAMAFDAGWIVLDPTTAPPAKPSEAETVAQMQQRAITRGVLHALGIAALVIIGLVILGNVVVFLAAQ